jgi:hypothetical protein
VVPDPGGKNVWVTSLNRKSWAWWHVPVIVGTGGNVNRRMVGWPSQKLTPYLKNNQSKRVGDMDLVVEHLSSKHKALSSNNWAE